MQSTFPALAKPILGAMMLVASHHALADFTQTLEITGYSLAVQDLTPDDTLTAGFRTASMTIDGSAMYDALAEQEGHHFIHWSPPFSQEYLSVGGVHGTASVTTTGAFPSGVLHNDISRSFLDDRNGSGSTVSSAIFNTHHFYLQPYTALTVQIPFTYSWESSGPGVVAPNGYARAVSMYSGLVLVDTFSDLIDTWSVSHFEAGSNEYSGVMSLIYVNNSSAEAYHSIHLAATADMKNGQVYVGIPAVPEPAVWGMWLAGILLTAPALAGRGGRHRRCR